VRTVVPHPQPTPGARANLELARVQQIALPDYGVLNPDEFAGVATDPGRRLIYVGTRGGSLLALSMETGAVEWELQLQGAISSVPRLADDDALMLLGTDNGELLAIELETRKTRWSYTTLGTIRNEPLVHDGTVYVVNSRDQVFALELKSGAWRWQYEQPYPTEFTVHGHAGLSYLPPDAPAAAGGSASTAGGDANGAGGGATAGHGAPAESGASAGSGASTGSGEPGEDGAAGGEAGGQLAGPGDAAHGVLFTGFSNGKVAAIGARSGEPLWVASAAPPAGGDFVDADGTPLILRDRDELVVTGQSTGVYGLGLTDGTERWFRPVRGAGSVVAGPRGLMIVASGLEGLFALEQGGRVRWRQQLNPGFLQTPLIVGDIAFLAHSDDGLLAFDVETGEFLAGLNTGSGISGPPVYDADLQRFYTLSNRGMLVVFRTVGANAGGPVPGGR
jgi:outer membrane protein assembly factor BamB